MNTAEIADRYLKYFERNEHTIVPSASLVSDDPSIMFTIAGMVPFIPYLNGVVPAPFPRAADVQKCIRTNDIEEVGKTARHGTFFQMLGNWSFGDYFKAGAIEYAWDLLTTPVADGGFGFAERDLWVTVYEDDDEAATLWQQIAELPAQRIQRLGRDDNYWHTGQPGPGGPCSEIYVDRGPAYGRDGGPIADDSRFMEIWNLVFMQHEVANVSSKSAFDIVGDLPARNIDTGMGLERVAMLKQGVDNMYETDQVRPVLDVAGALSGRAYGSDARDDVRFRVVADHVRSSLMLLSDGVRPANEGRGYILRRLMRRAIRSMRLLGVDTATFPELFAASRDAMQSGYPEIERDWARISQAAIAEEETFLGTLAAGSSIVDLAVSAAKQDGTATLGGADAFLLHDTYGFPIDLTVEIAEEAGLGVDRAGFDGLMQAQRTRAKEDARSRKRAIADVSAYRAFRARGETRFTGYSELDAHGTVLGILADGQTATSASAGQVVEVILDETSLYAESGGQVADRGRITGQGFELDVLDVQRPVPGLISHTVHVERGEVAVDDAVHTIVDRTTRGQADQAHSATHLVHAALRHTLGDSAAQAGSLNRPGYLRFDFSWAQSLSAQTKSEIEDIANQAIRDNLEVATSVLPLDDAKAAGAVALFGEKYGDVVRMVDIGGPWSRELCGGTHVSSTGEIGLINLIGESSIGSTNRRVEALVGADAFGAFARERQLVADLVASLKTPKDQLVERVADLNANLRAAEKRIAELESKELNARVPALLSAAERLADVQVIAADLGQVGTADDVRRLAVLVRDKLGSEPSVTALSAIVDERPVVIVATNEASRERGFTAGAIAKAAAAVLGGGGGGKPDLAQGGGTDVGAVPAALRAVRQMVQGA